MDTTSLKDIPPEKKVKTANNTGGGNSKLLEVLTRSVCVCVCACVCILCALLWSSCFTKQECQLYERVWHNYLNTEFRMRRLVTWQFVLSDVAGMDTGRAIRHFAVDPNCSNCCYVILNKCCIIRRLVTLNPSKLASCSTPNPLSAYWLVVCRGLPWVRSVHDHHLYGVIEKYGRDLKPL
jgi:hypothetical protein